MRQVQRCVLVFVGAFALPGLLMSCAGKPPSDTPTHSGTAPSSSATPPAGTPPPASATPSAKPDAAAAAPSPTTPLPSAADPQAKPNPSAANAVPSAVPNEASAARVPAPSDGKKRACAADSECKLHSNYCGGCSCVALLTDESAPQCKDPVACLRDPCGGAKAVCKLGKCEVSGSTGAVH